MVSQVLALSAIVALAQAKAIVNNQCGHDVYLWSIPYAQGKTYGLTISPGGRYEELWRLGTSTNPGIAIKVSPDPNGIWEGKSEINYQYTVDDDKIWINLANVRGDAFGGNVTFFTCHGPYKTPNVPTRQCAVTDDVELILCGTERTEPSHDITSPEVIEHCSNSQMERAGQRLPRRPLQCSAHAVGPKRTPQLEKANATVKPNSTTAAHKPKKEAKTVPLKTFLEGKCPWAHNGTGCLLNETNRDDHHRHDHNSCEHLKPSTGLLSCIKQWEKASNTTTHYERTQKDGVDPHELINEDTANEQLKRLIHKITYLVCSNPGKFNLDTAQAHDCVAYKKEIKDAYADVDKPVLALSRSVGKKPKIYLSRTCQSFIPHTKCSKVKRYMKKTNKKYDWTTDTESEDENLIHPHPSAALNSPIISISPMCHEYMPAINCTKVGLFMEHRNPGYLMKPGSHFINKRLANVKSADKKLIDKNLIDQKFTGTKPSNEKFDKALADIEARGHRGHKPVICVNSLCHQFVDLVSCHKIKKMAERKDRYHDYTTDSDKGCHTDEEM